MGPEPYWERLGQQATWLLYTHWLAGMAFSLTACCCWLQPENSGISNELLGRRLREQISQTSRERSWVQYWISSLQGVKVEVTECLLSSQSWGGGWAASQWMSTQCRSLWHQVAQFLERAVRWNVNIYHCGEASLNLKGIRDKDRFYFSSRKLSSQPRGDRKCVASILAVECLLSHLALWMCCGCCL